MGEEFGVDNEGRLDFFGLDGDAGGGPAGSPWDDEVDAGWDPSDHPDAWMDDGDGAEAWLRSLPPLLRAEVEARPPVTGLPWEAGPAAAAASFGFGGLGDSMLPGWALDRLLAEATVEGYAGLSDDELAGVLRAWQRQAAHGQACLAAAVRALAGRRAAGSSRAAEHVADELAAELTLTGRSAGRLLELAAGLGRLDEVRSAVLSGLIDWPRACVFLDELSVLDDAIAGEISARLVDPAAGWTTGQLRAALGRAVLAADPLAAERRKKESRKEARVELWREGSGNTALAGRELRPASAIMLDKKLTSDAAWLAACGVPGTRDQLRSLAYTTLLSGRDLATILDDPESWPRQSEQPGGQAPDGADAPAGGTGDPAHQTLSTSRSGSPAPAPHAGGSGDHAVADRPGRCPAPGSDSGSGEGLGRDTTGTQIRPAAREPAAGSVHLTMPLSAFAGGAQPGEVAGHGPVDAQTSRELAGLLARDPATRWCLTVTGPGGQAVAHACARRGPARGEPVITWAAGLRNRLVVLDTGACEHGRQSAGYVPPPRLRHLITIRQRTCAFPGCRRPARQCDLDHTIPFENGGLTCLCNLAPLCRRHHRAKQAPRWHLTQDQPGHMTWQLPSRREYHTTGDTYLG